jgi:uncharacterized membrane protein
MKGGKIKKVINIIFLVITFPFWGSIIGLLFMWGLLLGAIDGCKKVFTK